MQRLRSNYSRLRIITIVIIIIVIIIVIIIIVIAIVITIVMTSTSVVQSYITAVSGSMSKTYTRILSLSEYFRKTFFFMIL